MIDKVTVVNIIVVLLMSIACCHQVRAQDIASNTEGFSAELGLTYSGVTSNSFVFGNLLENGSSGVGLGIGVGYGFTPNLEAIGRFTFSNLNSNFIEIQIFKAEQMELGIKYNFNGSLQAIRPYLSGAIGWNTLKIDPVVWNDPSGFSFIAEQINRGYSLNIGAGLEYFLTPEIAIRGGAGASLGSYSELLINGIDPGNVSESIDFRIIGAQVAIKYHFY